MSKSSDQIIKDYYAAFNKQDWSGMLALLSDDVRHGVNQGGIEQGKDKFKAFLKVMDTHYHENLSDLVVMTSDTSGRAAAEFIINGKYLKSQDGLPEAKGQPYKLPVGAFFEIKDGLITRISNYYDLNLWIKLVSH